METESVKVDVKATVLSQSPLLGHANTVVISLNWEDEEFLVDESDGSVTSLGSSPASPSPPNPQIFHEFKSFAPSYVYKRLNSRFHDPVLSQQISDEIVVEAQRSSSQNSPLVIGVLVTLTQRVYVVVPCRPDPSLTRDLETEVCAVCLENLSESGSGSDTKPNCELPDCLHRFHEECFVKWYLDRDNNSCPLCRQSIYE